MLPSQFPIKVSGRKDIITEFYGWLNIEMVKLWVLPKLTVNEW